MATDNNRLFVNSSGNEQRAVNEQLEHTMSTVDTYQWRAMSLTQCYVPNCSFETMSTQQAAATMEGAHQPNQTME